MSDHTHADPFDTLGIDPVFDLDAGALRRAWMARSLETHPDRAGADEAARAFAARINDARRVLENPESRAEALLVRLGGPRREDDQTLPDGFLIEIMERREELEAAQSVGDTAAVERSRAMAGRERAEYISRVSALFRTDPMPPETLKTLRRELNAWRYFERLLEQVDPVAHDDRPGPG